jgi:glycosyltransferase involved in cell wall biosynthesis
MAIDYVALAFHQREHGLAWFNVLKALNEPLNRPLLVFVSVNCEWTQEDERRLKDDIEPVASDVTVVRYEPWPEPLALPFAQANNTLRHVLLWFAQNNLRKTVLYLHSDAVPYKPGWLEDWETLYVQSRQPYSLVEDTALNRPMGLGVFSIGALEDLAVLLLTRNRPWWHFLHLGNRNAPPRDLVFHCPVHRRLPTNPSTWEQYQALGAPKTAKMFHGSKGLAFHRLVIASRGKPDVEPEKQISQEESEYALQTLTEHFFRRKSLFSQQSVIGDRSPAIRIHEKRVVIRCRLDLSTGYGRAVINTARALINRGWDVRFNPLVVDTRLAAVPDDVRARIDPTANGVLVLWGTMDKYRSEILPNEICVTTWESTRLMPDAIENINANASAVVVPSNWNASCFSAQGVNVPIYVVPHGVSSAFTRTLKHKKAPSANRIFAIAGRVGHGGVRKGINEAIELFLKAFDSGIIADKVRLHVKCSIDCPVETWNDRRITVERRFMTEDELADWYRQADFFVSLATAEGFGLHQLEALACGVPLIACCYGGVADFFDAHCGFHIRFRHKPAKGVYAGCGNWAEYDKDSVIEVLREAARLPWKDWLTMSYNAARSADKFRNWTLAGERMEEALLSAIEVVQ